MSRTEDQESLRQQLEEVTEELERFKMTLEVVGTVDLEAGILNRNGVLEALERGRRWLVRRGDLYGAVIVHFPHLRIDAAVPEDRENLRHLAASISAGVREIDDVGRVEPGTFAAVLQDLKPGSVGIVTERIEVLLGAVARSIPTAAEDIRIGGVEVHTPEPTSPSVLDAALDLARTATNGVPEIGRI